MLEREYNYYNANKNELLSKYLGKFLLIRNEKLEGVYGSEKDAFIASQENKFELGTFLIQECKLDSDLKETFYSRVIFNQ